MTISRFISIPIIITLCLLASPVGAAGIEVSPAQIEFSFPEKITETTVQLTVANPTADVQVFEVYADDFPQSFTIQPASFTLESGTRKTLAITLKKSQLPSQANLGLAGTISIVGQPLAEGRVNVGTGIKLPFTVTLVGERSLPPTPWPNWLWALLGGASISVLWVVGLLSKKHLTKAA